MTTRSCRWPRRSASLRTRTPPSLARAFWQIATAKGTFRHDYLDVKQQVAATHVQFLEGKNQLLVSALLHVKDKKIEGIETLVQRITPEGRFSRRSSASRCAG